MRLRRFLWALLAASVASACSSSTSPSTTTVTSSTTETFSGTLSPGSFSIQTFTMGQTGTANVMLGALTPTGNGPLLAPPLSVPVKVGVGTPNADASACALVGALDLTPALTYQLAVPLNQGSGCVMLADTGSLTTTVTYTIVVEHP
jgi:hypothetical protein